MVISKLLVNTSLFVNVNRLILKTLLVSLYRPYADIIPRFDTQSPI